MLKVDAPEMLPNNLCDTLECVLRGNYLEL